jgi:hypothetical protein
VAVCGPGQVNVDARNLIRRDAACSMQLHGCIDGGVEKAHGGVGLHAAARSASAFNSAGVSAEACPWTNGCPTGSL